MEDKKDKKNESVDKFSFLKDNIKQTLKKMSGSEDLKALTGEVDISDELLDESLDQMEAMLKDSSFIEQIGGKSVIDNILKSSGSPDFFPGVIKKLIPKVNNVPDKVNDVPDVVAPEYHSDSEYGDDYEGDDYEEDDYDGSVPPAPLNLVNPVLNPSFNMIFGNPFGEGGGMDGESDNEPDLEVLL
jgi:hypothetical protein